MSSTPSIAIKCSFNSSISISLGVFAKNISTTSFKFLSDVTKISTATPILMQGSIILISVKFITIAPTKTTTQPNTSSNICRLTAF